VADAERPTAPGPDGGAAVMIDADAEISLGAADIADGVVPAWLAHLAALGWRVIAVTAFVIVTWFLASLLWTVTASVAISVVIAAAFAPFVLRLRAAGRSRTVAAAIVWAGAGIAMGAVLLLLLIAFVPYLGDTVAMISSALARFEDGLAAALPAGVQLLPASEDARSAILQVAGDVAESAAGIVTVLVLTTFLVFFFLRDGDVAWSWLFQATTGRKRESMTGAGREALFRVGGYLRGTSLLSGIIALTDLVFMLVLGVPLAVPLAVLVFVSGYIPYFGGIVTTFIVLLVTWSAVGPAAALAMVVLIAIRNAFLGYWIRPMVYGRSVSIHPALVLIVLPAGFQLAGVVGLFAAVPVTAVLFAVASATRELLDPEPPPPLPGLVPPWLDRIAQWSWRLLVGVALVGVLVGVFVAVPLVLLPMVFALIGAAALDPLVRGLVRRGWSRSRASAAVLGGSFLAVATVLLLSVAVLAKEVGPLIATAVTGAVSANEGLGGNAALLVDAARQGSNAITQAVASVASGVAELAVITVLGTLLAFYLLRDGSRLWRLLVGQVPEGTAPRVRVAGRRAFSVLGGYMIGTAAISFVGAASQLVIMLVLGLPLALPVFVLSFFLCFIPYIGGFISTGIAFLIAVAVGSTSDVIVMAIFTLVFNIVTGNFVSPLVYGKTVHLHPAVVLVAIPAAAAIAGVLGMFLVVPVIGVVSATWRTVIVVLAGRQDAIAGPLPDAGRAISTGVPADVEAPGPA